MNFESSVVHYFLYLCTMGSKLIFSSLHVEVVSFFVGGKNRGRIVGVGLLPLDFVFCGLWTL